jgi:twinkle protein
MLRHVECPHCGSSDAASQVPGKDIMKCFSCEKAWAIKGEQTEVVDQDFKDETWNAQETVTITGKVRGISPETFKQYDYYRTLDGNHIINHYDGEGNVVAQKIRYPDKTFSWKGKAGEAVPFGMSQFRNGGKRIIITEGELDALSVAEAIGCKYPVISVNNGAASARNDLKKHVEFLNSYAEITLAFDNDEAGKKAIQEVSTLFTPGKITIINLGKYKDFNELLQDKGKAGVLKAYYETQKFTPSGIVSGNQLSYDDVTNIDSTKSYKTPYEGINKMLRGFRKGELVTFTAGSGMGKTTMVREIAYDLMMDKNLKIGWVALEENTQRSALGFMSLHMDTPIYLEEERSKASQEAMHKAYDEAIANDRVFFYDHWGSLESEVLISKLRYLAVGAEVDFIFLDHISIVVSGGGYGDNERVAIDNLMTALRSLAEETKVGIVIISHLRRAQGDKGFENGHEVTLSHLRGSGGIAQLSDAVVALERDQQAETDSNVGNVRILKNRYTGENGLAGKVKYYKETGRLLDYEGFDNEVGEPDF